MGHRLSSNHFHLGMGREELVKSAFPMASRREAVYFCFLGGRSRIRDNCVPGINALWEL